MADIPYQLILRRVERIVQCNGQLDDTQPRAEMPAGLRDGIDEIFAHIRADGFEIANGVLPQVFRGVDAVEEGVGIRHKVYE